MRICLSLAFFAAVLQAQPADPWQPLRFLIGTWDARVTVGAPQNSGAYSFELELRDHVLVRHSTNGEHRDILYIYPEGPAFKAIYFDNEGHVIHYTVTTTPTTAVFQGDGFRLSYELKNGVMTGKFDIKNRPYLEWSGSRK
ncbi:MAG TPA: hypothetical protein VMT15_05085 [Bryobacteraceae bacterium]|nr:hypothetical protein [Bryobacteraceae bacterium]